MKKVIFIGNDMVLKHEFTREARDIEFLMLSVEEAAVYTDADKVIISDKMVQILQLDSVISKYQNKENVFYLISNSVKASIVDNQIAFAKNLGINVIRPHTSVSSIVAKVLGLTDAEGTLDNVISLFGTHAQVGVTSIALMIAKQLSVKNLRVCVLGLNQFNSGITWYEKYEGNTFDEMYEELVANRTSLTADKLERYLHYDENRKIHFLAGNKDYTKQNYFGAEEVDQLIQVASKSFDVVLLDLGCNPTNYLAIKGLERSGVKLVVANQLELSRTNWLQMHTDILRLLQITKDEFMMVINRYSYNLPYDQKRLSEVMSVPALAMISDFGTEGINAEAEYKLLVESGTKYTKREATNQIIDLTNALYTRLDKTTEEQKEKRGWLLRK